jgi:antitoxin component YwqK of YwqJK toxin-antitoxin module
MERLSLIFTVFLLISCSKNKKEIEYYTNGKVKYEIDLIDGIRHGEMISYYEDGSVKGRSNFKNGLLSGIARGYDSLTGHQLTEYNYVSNKRNGKFREFYLDGSIKLVGFFKEGAPDSLGYEYYPDGKVHKIYYYDRGKLFYYKALQPNGDFYDSILPISITELVSNDLGDSIAYRLKLNFSIYDSVRVGAIIGNLNSENRLVDTLRIIGSSDLETIYPIPIEDRDKGFSGIFYEVNMPEDIIMGHYWFKYPSPDSTNITKL